MHESQVQVLSPTLEPLGAVCSVNPGRSGSQTPDPDLVSFVPMTAVDAEIGSIAEARTRPISEVSKGYTRFEDGDILFAKITPCMENGKSAIAGGLTGGVGYGSTEFHVLRPGSRVLAEWVFYFVRQRSFRDEARDNFTGTAGQRRVPLNWLKNVEIPVPELSEQRRIVGTLKEALADVREAKEALERVPKQMKQFRQAVLAQAFRGELTADWRDANADRFREAAEWFDNQFGKPDPTQPSPILTAEQLATIPDEVHDWLPGDRLERIIGARRVLDRKSGKAPSPAHLNDGDDLPIGWTVSSLDALSGFITSGSRDWKRFYNAAGPGVFVMAQNVRPLHYDDTYRFGVNPPEGNRDRERSRVEQGDILVTIVGANTGDACAIHFAPTDYYVCQSVALIRPVLTEQSQFLELHLNAPWPTLDQWRDWIYGEGRPHLSFDHLKQTAIMLPPMVEQHEIVIRVERLFEQAAATETTATASLANLRRLEQSTLQAAFRGEL